MDSNKRLVPAGYLVALLMILIPMWDGLISLYPFHAGVERWRFGAVGAMSNLTLIPLVGFFLLLVLASWADHRRVRRIVGAICGILAVVFAAVAVLFVLDFFQTRAIVRPQFQQAMDIASATSICKQTATVLGLVLLGWAGLSGPKAAAKRKEIPAPEATPATPLIGLSGAARRE